MSYGYWGCQPVLSQLIQRLSIQMIDTETLADLTNARLYDTTNPNRWTLELWMKYNHSTAERVRMFVTQTTGASERCILGLMAFDGTPPTNKGDFSFRLQEPGGSGLQKCGELPNALTEDVWHHIVLAYSNPSVGVRDVQVFIDNVDTNFEGVGSWTNRTDSNTGVFDDIDMEVEINTNAGVNADWNLFSAALWAQNGVSSSQVSSLYANPRKDRRIPFGGYDSTMRDGLLHYWCPALTYDGASDTTLGTDIGITGTARNIMTDSTNITAADLLGDGP